MKFTKKYDSLLKDCIYEGEHKSGLKVIILQKNTAKKYATFSTCYGSINTEFVVPGETEVTKVIDGVAHFLEHKVFEQPDGTNAFSLFKGADVNAFTSFGVTNYLFSCTDYFYENFRQLLSYVQTPYFTEENVEKEKGIIAQEVRMYDDDPGQVCFYNCLKGLYKNHPVRTEIAGSVEEVMKTTPELLYKCYNTFYHPSNMAVICVGDIDPEKVGDIVDELITKDKPEGEIRQVFPSEPDEIVSPETEARFEIAMPRFSLGFKDIETGGDMLRRDIVTSALLKVLVGGSSPLFERLYGQGLINWSFGGYYEYERSFAFAEIGGESNDPKAVADAVQEEIARVKREGIDPEAWRRAMNVLYGRYIRLMGGDVEDIGNEYMFSFHRGVDLTSYPDVWKTVTIEDGMERLNSLFVPERSSLSIIYPKE